MFFSVVAVVVVSVVYICEHFFLIHFVLAEHLASVTWLNQLLFISFIFNI